MAGRPVPMARQFKRDKKRIKAAVATTCEKMRALDKQLRHGVASLPAAPIGWPALEVSYRKDDQLQRFDAVHDGEREALGKDAPRAQLPW